MHLVGGPKTIESFRAIGALDELRLMVLPIMTGTGRRLTPDVDPTSNLTFDGTASWPQGVVELVYAASFPTATR